MVTFKQVAFKKDMIKVVQNGQEVWFDCDPKAKGWAKSKFQDGDSVELVTEDRNGKPYVMQVRGQGQGGQNYQQSQASGPAPAPQSACQPSTAPQTTPAYQKPAYGQKTPEESEKITRLSVMSSASNAAQVLTGQINDPAVLSDVIISLYTKMLAEIKK